MIHVRLEPQSGIAEINVWIDESLSIDDLKEAWNCVTTGTLQHQIRDAIAFECVKNGISPQEVVGEPPQLN